MKTLTLSIFLLFISFHSFSQKKKEEEIFNAVEQNAEFPGGMGAFGKYLQKNLKWQGEEKIRHPSKLYLQFVVEKNGSISDFTVLKGPLSIETRQHFFKILSAVKWKPGYQSGKPVRSRFTIPMNDLNGVYEE
jgi:periplasmic protein TonB